MFSKFLNKGYEAQSCEICAVQFNLLKLQRIHKCKRCQKYVCFKCGNQKQKILDEDDKWTGQPHRVCIQCWKELNSMSEMVIENKMQWNRESLFAKDWMMKMNQGKPIDYEYEHFLKLFYSNMKNFEDEVEIIQKDVIKGRTDHSVFNYSLREFFFFLQQTQNKSITRKNMANVLYALAARYDQIGYVQGMSGVTAFLLCFCDENSAFTIFCDLIENIYPPKFFVKGNYGVNLIGMLAEIHFLKHYYLYWVEKVKMPLIAHERDPYDEQEKQQIDIIVQLCASKALLSLFTGLLAFSHLKFIWEELKNKRSFEVIQKAFIASLYLLRENIIQRKSFKVLEKLLENLNIDEFIEAYHDVEIDPEIKKKSKQQYFSNLSKKWSNSSEFNVRSLHKFTNFTQEEMKILQEYFLGKQNKEEFRIQKEQFIDLVTCYYNILREQLSEEDPILEITPYFVSKIFDSYHQSEMSTLDFREFICCLSVCTKSNLKQRLCTIINTYQDKNKNINKSSFEKLIKNLCQLSPETIEQQKQLFLERMNKNFKNLQKISISQLHILLNDNFIKQLAEHIKNQVPEIVSKMLALYSKR